MTVFLILFVLMIPVAVYAFTLRMRERRSSRKSFKARFYASAARWSLLVLIVFASFYLHNRHPHLLQNLNPFSQPHTGTGHGHGRGRRTRRCDDAGAQAPPSSAKRDGLRRLLMHEPRGHGAMSGAILQPPCRDVADWGVVFIEVSGYLRRAATARSAWPRCSSRPARSPVTEPETDRPPRRPRRPGGGAGAGGRRPATRRHHPQRPRRSCTSSTARSTASATTWPSAATSTPSPTRRRPGLRRRRPRTRRR